jgi:hypothetical protein
VRGQSEQQQTRRRARPHETLTLTVQFVAQIP